MAYRAFAIVLLSFLLRSSTISGYNQKEVESWCDRTPNPQPCKYFLTQKLTVATSATETELDFLTLSLKLAYDRAIRAKTLTDSLGLRCRNKLERAAWEDCMELYEHTISKLNRTMVSQCTQADAQTWLSTALTNLETCRAGFLELGVADNLLPLMSNNVTKLISNTLALNKMGYNDTPMSSYKGGFPTWVKPGDRKLIQRSARSLQAHVVVAADGSGNFRTVQQAIDAASKRSGGGRYVIHVKQGTYRENLEIRAKNVMLVGDGMGRTIITGSRSVRGGSTTFKSATVAVVGDGFIARDITFRNTAGAQNAQAVALRSGSDLSVFYGCSFEAYQDTLYVHSNRQFYKDCDIYGTVDFIFGNAAAVFQNCNIYARRPQNKTNTVTAQGRTDPNQNTGIVIHNSRITAAADLRPVLGSVKTYLGRPWRQYSRVVIMKTFLDGLIQPRGWLEWNGNFALNTLYYGEYMNVGPGSSTANRVNWRGFRVIRSVAEASRFTVNNFIAGGSWLPATRVPFTSGL